MRVPFDDLSQAAHGPLAAPAAMIPVRTRIAGRRVDAEDVVSLVLEVPQASPMEQPSPGAHVDIHLSNGMVRQYSLVAWSAGRLHIAVKREANGRGGSRCLFDAMPGDWIGLGAIRNSFPLRQGAQDSVLIAGGIGITPFVSMADRLAEQGREWTLYYAAKDASHAPFAQELERYGRHVRFSFREGLRFDLHRIVAAHGPDAHYYACGPAALLDGFRAATRTLPMEQVHLEHFEPATPDAGARGFEVELARSGCRLAVPPGRTMLQVLLDHGVAVAHSCEQGICGQCEVAVLSGAPDHRDQVLSDAEKAAGNTVMACCSRSLSPVLVLDC